MSIECLLLLRETYCWEGFVGWWFVRGERRFIVRYERLRCADGNFSFLDAMTMFHRHSDGFKTRPYPYCR
ncbi:MAG: hypothetical protein LBU27_07565 [Candidatus Peribacteria bacterium]|nr:hypothetical protein [Candidatus Peribacteria bacterium]